MRWGLVPSFTPKEAKPDFWKMFNARSETVQEKPSFQRLLSSRRCLVLFDGFYEWKKEGGGRQPYYIHYQGGDPMVMAGLFDVWHSPEGPLYSYTILTTDSCKRLQWLHDRMPVLLRDMEAQQLWLGTQQAPGRLQKLLAPYNGEDLVWYAVTRQMSSPAFQGPECCKELKKPAASAFFQPRRGKVPVPAPGLERGQQQAMQEGEQANGPAEGSAGMEGMAAAAGAGEGTLEGGAAAQVAAVNADQRPANAQQARREVEAGSQHAQHGGSMHSGGPRSSGEEEAGGAGGALAASPADVEGAAQERPPAKRQRVMAAEGLPRVSKDEGKDEGTSAQETLGDAAGPWGPAGAGSWPAAAAQWGSEKAVAARSPGVSSGRKGVQKKGAPVSRPPGQQAISKFFKRE